MTVPVIKNVVSDIHRTFVDGQEGSGGESLSLITMLTPLRNYFYPEDLMLSSFLCTAKERYFTRMLVRIYPTEPSFKESRWIISEDVNVEHLLDVFTRTNANSDDIWEGLLDDHPSKVVRLSELSRSFGTIENDVECKRLLTYALKLSRERGDDHWVADILGNLSDVNQSMGLLEEGIKQTREALDIWESLSGTVEQASCFITLAGSLLSDNQLDAAEQAILCAINLTKVDDQYLFCTSHRVLGNIYQSKGKTKEAIYHLELALGIASPPLPTDTITCFGSIIP